MSDDLKERLRDTTQQMAATCSVDMALWNYHSNACLLAADRIETLEAEVERLKEVLNEIAHSKFCDYDNTSPDSYGTGVTDGHRYCAKIARAALAKKGE